MLAQNTQGLYNLLLQRGVLLLEMEDILEVTTEVSVQAVTFGGEICDFVLAYPILAM